MNTCDRGRRDDGDAKYIWAIHQMDYRFSDYLRLAGTTDAHGGNPALRKRGILSRRNPYQELVEAGFEAVLLVRVVLYDHHATVVQ